MSPHERDDLVAASNAMRALRTRIELAARSDAPVLFSGEAGSGKLFAARLLHRLGARSAEPFVVVDCAAMHTDLGETALLDRSRGGMLALREIGDMPLPVQLQLQRLLQDRAQQADVQIVATTERDLARAAAEGLFRSDLLFRLDTQRLHLPPLGERLADIVPLAEHFLRRAHPGRRLAREAAQRLLGHAWPGNVRELREVVERAALSTHGALLEAGDLDFGDEPVEGTRHASAQAASMPAAVAALERSMIADALQRTAGNRAEAARVLGIRRQLLYAKLAALGLQATH